MASLESRTSELARLGATSSEIEELLRYNENKFDHRKLARPFRWPLADEPFVAVWQAYAEEARQKGAFATLREKLVQLRFPVRENVSQTECYQAATRRGDLEVEGEDAPLELQSEASFEILLHETPAGRIPLIVTRCREDFVTLVRALTLQNEPKPVPASMGACMVAGYNNWDRLRTLRQRWELANPQAASEEDWDEEFGRIIPHKDWYQDRFMILSDGPYSGISAREMGLSEAAWARLSMIIRREHEVTHYFTRRVFHSMRNNLIDEILADYMGIVAAAGYFRADWFLRFMGLERFPDYREGGRLENYRGNPSLSDGAFGVLKVLVKRAAVNLEQFDARPRENAVASGGPINMLMALTRLSLEELSSDQAGANLGRALEKGAG